MSDEAYLQDFCNSLKEKKDLVLTVSINSLEEAEELARWLYSRNNSPLKSTLNSINWDSEVVTKSDYNLLKLIKNPHIWNKIGEILYAQNNN